MKSNNQKKVLLENLRKLPIVAVACERAHVARSTFYRWKIESKEFFKAVDEAMAEGETFVTEISENQLVALIKDKNFSAIHLWLKSHHPKYNNKIEVGGKLTVEHEPLKTEQKELIKRSLEFAITEENYEEDEEN